MCLISDHFHQSLLVTGGHVMRRTVQFFMIWYHYLRRCIVLGNVKRVQPQAALAVDSGQLGLKPSTVEAPCLDGKKTCQICLNPVKFYRTSLNHLKHPEVSCSLDHGESPFYIPRKKTTTTGFSAWWFIPRIVSGWTNPGYFNGIFVGAMSTYNWGGLTHLRFVGWTTKYNT